ncbi:hypothetical protein Tco_0803442 [Tanacetum coccineum]|uniref:Uncharacterized protein n=1 Tax=Tanacetum coccineum TaxID=301880 RepID=A0ABQ5A1K5_9ASTR
MTPHHAPNDSVHQQQGIDKGTKITLIDQLNARNDSKDPADKIEYLDDLVKMISKDTTKDMPMKWNFNDDQPFDVSSDEAEANGQDLYARIPAELKVLPTKVDDVTNSIGALKEYVETMEMEVPTELKQIPERLTKFNNSISALTTRVANLEAFKLDIPTDMLALPGSFIDVVSQFEKLKVLDAIPDIMNMVTLCLDKFVDAISSASN